MALTILNEQYPPRKPKLTLTADSLDELPTEGVAEGSTATVDGTEYAFDSTAGWIEPGAGGGGSGGGIQWETIFEDTLTFIKGQYDYTATVQESLFDTSTFLRITIGSGLASIVLPQAMGANNIQASAFGSVNIGGTSASCSVNVTSDASMNETLFNLGFQEYSADGNVDVAIKIEKMIV